ncbi:MAG: Rho termination factor N-terminal domain-containing protein, partial [Bacteroidales bacterium]|nr:Rho termination factor N-terminal domain-containing protein [Bacteroidales bacterium]
MASANRLRYAGNSPRHGAVIFPPRFGFNDFFPIFALAIGNANTTSLSGSGFHFDCFSHTFFMLNILELNAMEEADLLKLAEEYSIRKAEKLSRQDLIYKILDAQALKNAK